MQGGLLALAAAGWSPPARPASAPAPEVLVHNLWDVSVPYDAALAWQRAQHAERIAALQGAATAAATPPPSPPPGALLLLQHPPVLTLGRSSSLDHVHASAPFELVRTERGGEVTYHGPGQLVAYPILDLRAYEQDVRWYMGALEEVAIRTCNSLGVRDARRADGLTRARSRRRCRCRLSVARLRQ